MRNKIPFEILTKINETFGALKSDKPSVEVILSILDLDIGNKLMLKN